MDTAWQVIGASVQGSSHLDRGQPCEDAYAYRILPSGVIIIAVADGAGSAARAVDGAQFAVTKIMSLLEEKLSTGLPGDEAGQRTLLVETFQEIHQSFTQLAEESNVSTHAFATTLTCAIASENWLIVGQVGDGVVVGQMKDGTLFAATQPQHGEYANETYFLTMAEALSLMEIQIFTLPLQGIAVLSDGLTRLALDITTHSPYSPFFNPLFAFAGRADDVTEIQEQFTAFLASDRICARTNDDRTLVLAVQLPMPEVPMLIPDISSLDK